METFSFELPGDAGQFLRQARSYWQTGNYDAARIMYQKCAYATTTHGSEEEKSCLKKEQAGFAKEDPLYLAIIQKVKSLTDATPGILQTAVYDQVPYAREEVQRALYFGHELGDIRREKKGRSFAIYPV